MSNPTPGYLLTLHAQEHYLGGMMITDHHGIPVDFKYTDPVNPTKVQRMIYGSVLDRYIRNHVILTALAKEIAVPPTFFLAMPDQIADIQEATELTVISVERTKFASLREQGSVSRSKDNESLVQGHDDQHPLRVCFGGIPTVRQSGLIDQLVRLTQHMDVVEPLERLKNALHSLCFDEETT